MAQRIWFITGVSSGFGRHLAEQLLQRGDKVIGTIRSASTKLNHLEENLGAVAVDLTPKEIRTTLSQIKVQGVRTPESAPTDP